MATIKTAEYGAETERVRHLQGPGEGSTRRLSRMWANRRIGWVAGVLLVSGFALISGWLTPRGPTTATAALISMGAAAVVGMGVGLLTASRWSLVVSPLVFIAVFETVRIGLVGPTVDAINLGSFYGIVAFVLGRGFHGVLVLGPIMLGDIYGVWLARRLGHSATPTSRVGSIVATLATVALVALAAFIARPASTPPVFGPDGEPLPGSIAEILTVEVGGHEQVLLVRGRSVDSPVLLYLTGGPGGTDIGAMRRDVSLEQDFVVVTWDQRGAGKSYAALDPTVTFTADQFVSDAIEVTEYLTDRFDEDKVYLVGQSWGSTLGVLAADARPDLYHAFVGVGQMVSQRETDRIFWEASLAWAADSGNEGLVATLEANGPPPYTNLYDYAGVISYEHQWNAYPGLDVSHEMPGALFVPEYTFMDRVNAFKGFLDTNASLYPQLQDIDFRRDITRLDVPYVMVLGEHEALGRSVLADEWFEALESPTKERIVFEESGHRPNFDRPAEFAALMNRVVTETSGDQNDGRPAGSG